MKLRILFVDDEPMILQGVQRMLRHKRADWEMAFAESGPKALELMAAQPIDVVITDMLMPGMNGADLLKQVKNLYPATVRIVGPLIHVLDGAIGNLGSNQDVQESCGAEEPSNAAQYRPAVEGLLGQPCANLALAQVDTNRN